MSLSALLERVEGATGGDREIDDAIVERMFGKSMLVITEDAGTVWRNHKAPFYTSSVDAALALIGRVLPGLYMWRLDFDDEPTPHPADALLCWAGGTASEGGATPALALCAALLAAMIGEEAKP